MKKYIWIAGILLLSFSSCNGFLDYNENSDYDQQMVFNTTWSNEDFVTGIYSYLPGGTSDIGSALRSSGCDEAEYSWPSSGIQRYYDSSWSARNTIDDKWSTYYKAIRLCNDYLENGTGKTWEQFQYDKDYAKIMRKYKNREWEVKALRAYYYFELVKRYNRIPLITTLLSEEESNRQKPVSYQDVVDFIVKECDEVSKDDKLPTVYDGYYDNETGRVTRQFALALKARALLYAASPLNNPEAETNSTKWIKAAEAAKVLIDHAGKWGLSLVPFDQLMNADNYKSAEVILAKRIGDNNDFERTNFPIGVEGGNGGNCPTQNLVDVYDLQDGKEADNDEPYANRDPRLGYTVLYQGGRTAYGKDVDLSVGGVNGLPKPGATPTGYYLNKFVNKNISLTANSTTTSRHSMPLFRYAEILLIYAEAMNEAYGPEGTDSRNGLDMTALDAINQVRGRTGLNIPLLTLKDVPSKELFRKALRKERMAELAFEDHRFWDIRRWKIGPESAIIRKVTVTKENDKNIYTYSFSNRIWNDCMYFYPIPQSEIYKNPNLIQNPGWEEK